MRLAVLMLIGWPVLASVAMGSDALLVALTDARQEAENEPNDPERQLAVGRLLAKLGAVEDALVVLDEVVTLAPSLAEPYHLGALLLRDTDRHEEAIARLEQALKAGVQDPAVREELGFLRLGTGDAAGARQMAEMLVSSHRNRSDAWLLLGLSLAADPDRRSEAAEKLERAVDLGLKQPARAHLELGALLIETDRTQEALAHLQAARDALPDHPESYYKLGNALRAAGDLEGARAVLERFQTLSRAADDADHGAKALGAWLNEVQALALDNRLEEALAGVHALREVHPDAPAILALEAKITFSIGEQEAALDGMTRAVAGNPSRAEYHYLVGQFAVALGRLAQAQPALERAVVIQADLAEGHRLLGLVHAQQGHFTEAEASLRRALGLGVDGADFRRAFAEVLKRLGRQQESDEQMAVYRRLAGN